MATDLKLTWDRATKRWVKIYRGRKLYLGYGKSKTDRQSYQLALEQFDIEKAKIDREAKPFAAEYEQAINLRREMVRWLELTDPTEYDQQVEQLNHLERELHDKGERIPVPVVIYLTHAQEHARLNREIERLNTDFQRVNPPELCRANTLPIDPLVGRTVHEQHEWRERVAALRSYQRWTQVKDPANTLEANIAIFLKQRATQARAGKIAAKRYDTCRRDLEIFKTFIGPLPIEQFNGKQLTSFHTHLLEKTGQGDYSKPYAKTILTDVKHFVTWLWEQEVIAELPRNFKRLTIELLDSTPQTIPIETIKGLLKGATGRVKLYILLTLNCGFTQKDIADLAQEEVNWQLGVITRKRSKTRKHKTCPVVIYKLWPETFKLLKENRSDHPTLALVNDRGNPLRQLAWKDGDKLKTNDSIRKALVVLCNELKIACPAPKLFRKTSSTLLYNAPKYRGLDELFLRHAPSSVAAAFCNRVGDAILDEAIDYLAEQYGVK